MLNMKEERKFTAVCERRSFVLIDTKRNTPNRFSPTHEDDVLTFERVSADGRAHRVRVTLDASSKSWILFYVQTNQLVAPCHGDNAKQLDRTLAGESF